MGSVSERVRSRYADIEHILGDKVALEKIMLGVSEKVDEYQQEISDTYLAWESLRGLLSEFSDKSIKLFEEMLNKGVSAIFNDRRYKVELEVTDHKRKSVKLYLLEDVDGDLIRSRIPDAVGGGIQVVISFIFRVFLIRVYSLRPFIVLDEAFSQISSLYLGNFIEFLQYLVKEMDFVFMWVTQDKRVPPLLDNVYRVSMGAIRKEDN